jgi:hypothetical protein
MKRLIIDKSINFIRFLEYAKEYLEVHNKKLELFNSRNINFDGGKCAGWCDGKTIAIATKNSIVEEVFAHEFSHMNQAVESSPLWKENYKFWNLLDKQNFSPKNWQFVMEIIALERDCEIRTIKHSKKWNLFDNAIYAQRANLYLYFYQYVFLKQKWVSSTGIYNQVLIDEMPEKILPLSNFSVIDMDLMKLFDECLMPSGKFYTKEMPKSANKSNFKKKCN